MFILLTYDIEFNDENSKKRLKKVAKYCEKYGIRVQNSVFELNIHNGDLIKLKNDLLEIISENDSIRIYKIGNNFQNKVEVLGKLEKIELSSNNSLIF